MTLRSKSATLIATIGTLVLGAGGAGPARAVHNLLTLELTPETSRNPQGTTHTVQATLSAPSPLPQLEVHFKIISGPNAKDPVVLTEPDHTCVITTGQTQCVQPFAYQDRRSTPTDYTDTIVGWIDHDPRFGRNSLSLDGLDKDEVPDAAGPPHEPGISGHAADKGEPDSTDVVLKSWGQLGASALPLIDGLERRGTVCRGEPVRADRAVVATVRRCTYLMALPANREEDGGRAYYALWMQAEAVITRSGWCATRFRLSLSAPSSARVVSVAVPARGRSARDRLLQTRLPVRAAGFAFEPGLVEQSAFYRPGVVSSTRSGRTTTVDWRGKSRLRLGAAVGAELALAASAAAPKLAQAARVDLTVRRC